jgi:hypothetical protein
MMEEDVGETVEKVEERGAPATLGYHENRTGPVYPDSLIGAAATLSSSALRCGHTACPP